MDLAKLTRIFWKVAVYICVLLLPFCVTYNCSGFREDLGHLCQHCYETCRNSISTSLAGCVYKCMGLSKSRQRRDACPTVCPKNYFCDPDMNSCTECGIYCYKHEVQKTSAQCLKFCPDVYWASTTTTSATTTTTTTPADDASIDVIVLVLILVGTLFILIVGVFIYLYRKKLFRCLAEDVEEPQKTSLPCSQDLDEHPTTSKTPLTGPPSGAMGPVKQDQNPHTLGKGDLGHEYGYSDLACHYTLLDGPSAQTPRKERFSPPT